MTHNNIGITELVLRDGHQSLIATRMRTEDMLPICGNLDRAGFWALEVWGGATFDTCIRFLREDPWVRLRKLRRGLPNSRLQMLLRGQNLLGYRHYADDVVIEFVNKAADNGIDVFRIFDALNDFRNMRVAIEAVKKTGKHAQGTISYTTSPLHSVDKLATLADDFANSGCDSIAIKDMAGIMTPANAAALVKAVKARTPLPVHVHAHATSGLAAASLLAAVDAGADVVESAISAFSEGASHPATESIAAALSDAGYHHKVDTALLNDIAAYFRRVRCKYWQFESPFTGVDPRVLEHHVPGGMISNLSNQLKEQNALDKIDEVLAEIPRVRRDLGYPPLVTPTSQIVGAQAVLNVIAGERYKMVSNEVKNYLLGQYGRIPGEVDADLRTKAGGDDKTITCRPADLLEGDEMERLRTDIGKLAKNDEDVLIYAMFPELAKTFLQERAADTLRPEPLLPHSKEKVASEPKKAPSEFNLTVHGETYHVCVTGAGHKGARERPFYMTLDDVPTEVMVETLGEVAVSADDQSSSSRLSPSPRLRPSAPGHISTAMPGTVLEVLVALGDTVQAGTPVLIMEAMKMENEIQAPISGQVTAILVQKGDAVTPDEVLLEISA